MNDLSPDQIRKRMTELVTANIGQYGWHVQAVFPTNDTPCDRAFDFCYTVGLWEKWQHPELIVFGLRPEIAHAILSTVVEQIKAGTRYEDGQTVGGLVQDDYRIFFRAAPNDDDDWPTSAASAYYGHKNYPVVQLVLEDAQHRFPWDDGCDEKIRLTQQALVRE